jgi:hypothetical protein
MRQSTQDYSARRFSPSQFDCELPPDARQEMFKPKRPVILGRPVYQPPDRSGLFKWVIGFGFVAIILAGTIANHLNQQKPVTTKQSTPVVPTYPRASKARE